MELGFDTGVISGTTRQLRLYEHLGFRAFGPLVGSEGAWYQPMQIGAAEVTAWPDAMPTAAVVNCLPGPVSMRSEVQAAFEIDMPSPKSPWDSRTLAISADGSVLAFATRGGGRLREADPRLERPRLP